jgi:hypothetical protein
MPKLTLVLRLGAIAVLAILPSPAAAVQFDIDTGLPNLERAMAGVLWWEGALSVNGQLTEQPPTTSYEVTAVGDTDSLLVENISIQPRSPENISMAFSFLFPEMEVTNTVVIPPAPLPEACNDPFPPPEGCEQQPPEIIVTPLGTVDTSLSGVLRAELFPPPDDLSISPSSLQTPTFAYGRLVLEDLVSTTFLDDDPVITDVLSGPFAYSDAFAAFRCGGTTATAYCNSNIRPPYPSASLSVNVGTYSFEEVFGTAPPPEGSLNVSTFGLGSVHFEIVVVPDPSTALLLASGLIGLAINGRRRRG